MRKSLLMFAAIIAVCFASCNNADGTTASEEDSTAQSEKIVVSDTIQNMRLAMQLATYGYQTESPMALVEAAEILSDIDIQDLKPESVEENIKDKDAKKDDTNDPTKEIQKKEHGKYTVAELLEDAKKMAADDQNLLSIIDNLQATSGEGRGAVGGPRSGYYRLHAGCHTDFVCAFKKGVTATVVVSGDGDTDLDLYVYDENGRFIARDSDYSDDCIVTWVPRWTGNYTIRIVNRGSVWNDFVIATN